MSHGLFFSVLEPLVYLKMNDSRDQETVQAEMPPIFSSSASPGSSGTGEALPQPIR